MIQKKIQIEIAGVISREMIPEYKELIKCKDELKDLILNYVHNEYINDYDRELIKKYSDSIYYQNSIIICNIYSSNFKLAHNNYIDYSEMTKLLTINFDENIPLFYCSLEGIKSEDKILWKKFSKKVHTYINLLNTYLNKIKVAYDFLNHKNTTLTLIKNNFPELYKAYKSL